MRIGYYSDGKDIATEDFYRAGWPCRHAGGYHDRSDCRVSPVFCSDGGYAISEDDIEVASIVVSLGGLGIIRGSEDSGHGVLEGIGRGIANGKLDLVISYMLYSENKRGPNAMARDYNLDFMRKYHKVYVGIDKLDSLQPLIRGIMAAGIKSADATHIACAISAGCDYLITTDDRMLKYKDERIRMITPTEMVYVMEV